MNKLSTLILSCLMNSLLFASPLFARIDEINKIDSINYHIQDDTLVLMNVGYTLFSSSSCLANNQWREYFVTRVHAVIEDEQKAQSLIDSVKGMIVEQIPKIPAEPVTPQVIAQLQESKVAVLGYSQRQISTTYAPNNGLIVHHHLTGMGINLEKTLMYLKLQNFRHQNYAFEHGIIFTNKNSIGPAFAYFFEQANFHPKLVIVVDDNINSLKEAEIAIGQSTTDFLGLRYSKTDANNQAFNADVGTIQSFAFINDRRLLTDEEATLIKNAQPEINHEALLDDWIQSRL